MKIIIYGVNYSPELTGVGKYSGELGEWLALRGHDVSVIAAPPYYPEWKVYSGFPRFRYSSQILHFCKILRCPLYVPSTPTFKSRILHLATFALTSGLGLFSKLFLRPDVVIMTQPTLFCAPAALLFCKISGAKSVLHIQDFELDAALGSGLLGENRFFRMAIGVESWLTSKFDLVSTISQSMINRAIAKGAGKDKVIYFPNWADTDSLTPFACGAGLRQAWGIPVDSKVVMYSGNIGEKQGLEILFDVAARFSINKAILFLIVSSSSYVTRLQEGIASRRLSNVMFKPQQPWETMSALLCMADIHLVIQKADISDSVLPSKLASILAVGGHALVTSNSDSELSKLNDQYPGLYKVVEPENENAISEGISQLLDTDLNAINETARSYAETALEKKLVLSRFCRELENLVG